MAAHGSNSASGFSGVSVVGGGVRDRVSPMDVFEADDLEWRLELPLLDILRCTVFNSLSVEDRDVDHGQKPGRGSLGRSFSRNSRVRI